MFSLTAHGETVEVSSVEELKAALATQTSGKEIVLKQSGSPYLISSTLSITNAITLRGETGTPGDVVINAQNKCSVINITSTAKGAVIVSLTVTGGVGVNASETAQACRAGGITFWSAATVTNCTITGCVQSSNSSGVGLYVVANGSRVTHCRISSNTGSAAGAGGGVYLKGGDLCDCLIVGNYCGKGGGVYVSRNDTSHKIVNCTIAGNSASDGGGIWYDWKGCQIINTVIYGNSATTNPDRYFQWYGGDGSYNCACSSAFGNNPVTLTASPFTSTYELDPATGAACIDAGDNSRIASSKDFFGNDRIFNDGTVDIGAHEYSKIEVVPGIATDRTTGAGPTAVELKATVQGASIADCTFAWYLDDSATVSSHDQVWTNTFDVGKHSLKLVVTYDDADYPVEKPLGYITIYPTDAYVDLNGNDPVWPYDTMEHAATNLETAVSEVLRCSGVTLHVPAGLYPLKSTVSIGAGRRLVGAGRDKTILYNPKRGTSLFRNLVLNGSGAYVSGICVSNGTAGASQSGSGVLIDSGGGTFEDGMVTDCVGGQNADGAGVQLIGASCVMRRTIICNNRTQTSSGDPKNLFICGGVMMGDKSLLEDCLVVGNKALSAGGVRTSGGTVRNCTIVGNTAGATSYYDKCIGGGGLSAIESSYQNWSIANCIIYGNRDAAVSESESAASHDAAGATYRLNRCCVPVATGNSCMTGNPQFKNAAAGDYRIWATSPCAYSGTYQSWMATATDLWGNLRTTPGKKVSIGCCQASAPGLMLIVR